MLPEITRRLECLRSDQLHEPVPGLHGFRQSRPHRFQASIYRPLMCLIVQGSKEMSVGGRRVLAEPGSLVLVSHTMPVVARVVDASEATPFLSVVVMLDLAELRSLDGDLPVSVPVPRAPEAVSVSPADASVLAVYGRYLALADDPHDARVLAPLVRRELHWRLLRSSSGGMLRQLLHRDSHASRIARAIQVLGRDYKQRLEMDAIARAVGMSPSAFYKHFKATTSTTPLKYQKDLRLTEGRRLLLTGQHTVSTAAFAVGYESASQFSREYGRKFGGPPSRDLPRRGEAVGG